MECLLPAECEGALIIIKLFKHFGATSSILLLFSSKVVKAVKCFSLKSIALFSLADGSWPKKDARHVTSQRQLRDNSRGSSEKTFYEFYDINLTF